MEGAAGILGSETGSGNSFVGLQSAALRCFSPLQFLTFFLLNYHPRTIFSFRFQHSTTTTINYFQANSTSGRHRDDPVSMGQEEGSTFSPGYHLTRQ
jgi:hypothetical protein